MANIKRLALTRQTVHIKVLFKVSNVCQIMIHTRAKCHKTCYVGNLRIFVIVFVAGELSQPSLMFVSKARVG